jgi:hypothetical protein
MPAVLLFLGLYLLRICFGLGRFVVTELYDITCMYNMGSIDATPGLAIGRAAYLDTLCMQPGPALQLDPGSGARRAAQKVRRRAQPTRAKPQMRALPCVNPRACRCVRNRMAPGPGHERDECTCGRWEERAFVVTKEGCAEREEVRAAGAREDRVPHEAGREHAVRSARAVWVVEHAHGPALGVSAGTTTQLRGAHPCVCSTASRPRAAPVRPHWAAPP